MQFRRCPFEGVTRRYHQDICLACLAGACRDLQALGLCDDGTPLPTAARPRCGAKNRKGSHCKLPVEPGKRRCRLHGGASTGPKTAEGRARIAEAQRKRWGNRR
ncbi:HGGxSTG domain-containing protein [Pseudophaeobacter sp. A-200-2]|uniref:HGGxSTG domain-containing protein n=1 Tax=Pseudophaeobacter sp. A-200-2 TaxID=3098145 RepID=UPI0034D52663